MFPAEVLAHLEEVYTQRVVLRMMGITDVTVVLNLVNSDRMSSVWEVLSFTL